MEPKTLLEGSLHKPMMNEAVGCAASVPLILAAVVVVNLFIGDDQLPREIRGSTPWFALATAITGAGAGWFWRRNRIRLKVIERDGERFLEIYDPSGPVVLQEPWQVEAGWFRMHMPKVGTQTTLVVGVYQEGELQVAFTEEKGSLFEPPTGWKENLQLPMGDHPAYAVSGMGVLQKLVQLGRG